MDRWRPRCWGRSGWSRSPSKGLSWLTINIFLSTRRWWGIISAMAAGHLFFSPSGFNEGRDQETKGDVWLTLDKNIQFATEEILSRTVEESRAKGGMAIVLNPKTGDVLAMASVPNFDPNHAGDFSPEHWRNRAVTDLFEPGSAFKPITFAAALESGVLNLEESIFCEDGNYTIDGRVIRDSHPYQIGRAS